MRLIDDVECGPACRFGDAHIYYALSLLDKEKPLSRRDLSDATQIGEGSIRKIIDILKEWRAISVKQTGIIITDAGRELMERIPITMIEMEKSAYAMGAFQQGVLVHGAADKITNGMYQRDRGIIAGANGASVFIIKDGKLIMPKSWDMDTRDPEFARSLRGKGMKEGDAVIISGASDINIAAIAAISIALDLL